MYVIDGELWTITKNKAGQLVHENVGPCNFTEIKPGQIAIRTLYTVWTIKSS